MFLSGGILGISWELILAQQKVDDIGESISEGPIPALIVMKRDREEIEKHLNNFLISVGYVRMEVFDEFGREVAISSVGSQGETDGDHGFLTSSRVGIRDISSGREIAHLVIWRNMGATAGLVFNEVVDPPVFGLIAGLIAVLIAWPILSRRLSEED